MIKILLADDHPVVRVGLRAMLHADAQYRTQPGAAIDLQVVAEATNPEAAVRLSAEHAPDVVLMDLQFGADKTGADATRRIRELANPPAVLVLTNYDTDGDILGAVEAGACGYLLKDTPPEELIAAIRAAAAGETALAPGITARLLARMRTPQPTLSARETEVLNLVAEGASNNDIAARLQISDATVKSHLTHIYNKLTVSSRTAALAAARSAGILSERNPRNR